jgi:hypothetical protein
MAMMACDRPETAIAQQTLDFFPTIISRAARINLVKDDQPALIWLKPK